MAAVVYAGGMSPSTHFVLDDFGNAVEGFVGSDVDGDGAALFGLAVGDADRDGPVECRSPGHVSLSLCDRIALVSCRRFSEPSEDQRLGHGRWRRSLMDWERGSLAPCF